MREPTSPPGGASAVGQSHVLPAHRIFAAIVAPIVEPLPASESDPPTPPIGELKLPSCRKFELPLISMRCVPALALVAIPRLYLQPAILLFTHCVCHDSDVPAPGDTFTPQ